LNTCSRELNMIIEVVLNLWFATLSYRKVRGDTTRKLFLSLFLSLFLVRIKLLLSSWRKSRRRFNSRSFMRVAIGKACSLVCLPRRQIWSRFPALRRYNFFLFFLCAPAVNRQRDWRVISLTTLRHPSSAPVLLLPYHGECNLLRKSY